MDESGLREKARELMRTGGLPARRPGRMWGGPGSGGECAICGGPLTFNEVELELEFQAVSEGGDALKCCVHVHCFAAWELELQNTDAYAGTNGFSADPDARLTDDLSEAREDGTITYRERDHTHRPGSA